MKKNTTFAEMHQRYLADRLWGQLHRLHPSSEFARLMQLVIEDAEAKFHEVRAKYPFVTRAMKMRDFYRICNRENIWVYIEKLTDGDLGLYFPDTIATRPTIALSKDQSRESLRMAMAHEVAHHFLHRESIKAKEFKPWNGWKNYTKGSEYDFGGIVAEMEADALASMFLAGGEQNA